MTVHPIAPVWNEKSRVLILGSFPSARSRADGFFYAHPRNRFWQVIAAVTEQSVPQSETEKRQFLLENRIALWDVVASCDVTGSSDSSIRDVTSNDIRPILTAAPIVRIFVNGGTAAAVYRKYIEPVVGVPCVALPSTSPANAAWSLTRLCEAWGILRYALRDGESCIIRENMLQ